MGPGQQQGDHQSQHDWIPKRHPRLVQGGTQCYFNECEDESSRYRAGKTAKAAEYDDYECLQQRQEAHQGIDRTALGEPEQAGHASL